MLHNNKDIFLILMLFYKVLIMHNNEFRKYFPTFHASPTNFKPYFFLNV